MGGHGLPKVSFGSAMPYPARRVGGLWPSPIPLDSGHPMPYAYANPDHQALGPQCIFPTFALSFLEASFQYFLFLMTSQAFYLVFKSVSGKEDRMAWDIHGVVRQLRAILLWVATPKMAASPFHGWLPAGRRVVDQAGP
jgi:hypothetical protein